MYNPFKFLSRLSSIETNALLTIFCRFLGMAAGFATSLVTARVMGPTGRGEYFYVITLASMIAQFGNLGLHASNSYLVAQDERLARNLTINGLWISCLLGGGTSAITVMILAINHTSKSVHFHLLPFALILAPVSIFFMLNCNLLVGLNRLRAFNLVQCGTSALTLILISLIALTNSNTPSLFLSAPTIALLIACSLLANTLLRNPGAAASYSFDWPLFQKGFSYSLKAYLATLFGYIILRGNVFVVEALRGSAELGVFSVALQLMDVMIVVPTSFAMVLFPKLMRTRIASRWNMMTTTLALVAFLMLIECLAAGTLGRWFISNTFGAKYRAASDLLLYLLPGTFCLGLCSVISQSLAADGFPRSQVLVWIMTAVVALPLCWYLTVLYGAKGSAISLSVAHGLALLLLWISACRRSAAQKTVSIPDAERIK